MLPATRSLLEALSAGDRGEEPLLDAGAPAAPEHFDHDDPKGFEMVMRRKRRAALFTAMLRSQGYDDLARMAAIRETQGD